MGREVKRKHVTPEGLKDCTAETVETCTAKGFDGSPAQHFELGQEEAGQKEYDQQMAARHNIYEDRLHKSVLARTDIAETGNAPSRVFPDVDTTGAFGDTWEQAQLEKVFSNDRAGYVRAIQTLKELHSDPRMEEVIPRTATGIMDSENENPVAVTITKDGQFAVVPLGRSLPRFGNAGLSVEIPTGDAVYGVQSYKNGKITRNRVVTTHPDGARSMDAYYQQNSGRAEVTQNRDGSREVIYYASKNGNPADEMVGRWDSTNGWTKFDEEQMQKFYDEGLKEHDYQEGYAAMRHSDDDQVKGTEIRYDSDYRDWRNDHDALVERMEPKPSARDRVRDFFRRNLA